MRAYYIWTVFKRELTSYFATPIAYVFIVIFLFISGIFTFYLGNFFERGQADLLPFFMFHPWLYLSLHAFAELHSVPSLQRKAS